MTDDWLPDLTKARAPKYLAIADALGSAIERGNLSSGDRLPPQRDLAARLGVDLTTVTRAYETARRRGLIEAHGRAGSFVRGASPAQIEDAARVDTGMNMPPELPGDMLGRAMRDTIATLLADGSGLRMQYQPIGGSTADRAAGARLIARAGADVSDDQIVVTAGAQNALHAIVNTALRPGDAVACGRFVYSGFKVLAARLGLRLVPLPTIDGDVLAAACRSERIRALYVVPTNDNPTAVTLDATTRQSIAQAARANDLTVIEDDVYGALCATRAVPIAALAPERTWYVASVSKTISPALRIAYVRAPDIGGALRLAADVHETAIMAPPLNAAVVRTWLDDGRYDRLVEAMRNEAMRRQAIAADILKGLPYQAHAQGYHLWLPLPAGPDGAELADAMQSSGLSVVAGDRFRVAPGADQAVRISLGGLIETSRLARALHLMRGHFNMRQQRLLV
ncbi:PLP-dependent aminotransferase family protein [Sphingomonas asaccharolytica]|uniref:aminotransferase-like domain-containing protein n=1 Tax=Sphingomonas asaccharolytica TaxID=40681 RepID=UPI00082CA157|nr:PLP-dependent aminotransferase family protein [Sphingomonas asaccharolytica]